MRNARATIRRSRLVCATCAGVVIALGLLSRTNATPFPSVLGKYPGDALWASMVFALFAAVSPRNSTGRIALAALAFCCLVEFSQLCHARWIDAVRERPLGGLVLGSQFNALDFVAYAAGVAVAAMADALLRRQSVRARDRLAGEDVAG